MSLFAPLLTLINTKTNSEIKVANNDVGLINEVININASELFNNDQTVSGTINYDVETKTIIKGDNLSFNLTSNLTKEFTLKSSFTQKNINYQIEKIGDNLFENLFYIDEKITNCSIIFAIDNGYTRISQNAFKYGVALTKIYLPNTLISIDDYAFSGCSNLSSINFPNQLTNIGNYAFQKNLNLKDITNGFTNITNFGEGVFIGCSSITSVGELNSSLTSISKNLFNGCSNLEAINIPDNVALINEGAFASCTSLRLITLTENSKLNEIDSSAFKSCKSLTSFYFPQKLKKIGGFAFNDNVSMKEINLPASIIELGNGAFQNCSGTQIIYLNWEVVNDIALVLGSDKAKNIFKGIKKETKIFIPQVTNKQLYIDLYNEYNNVLKQYGLKVFGPDPNIYNFTSPILIASLVGMFSIVGLMTTWYLVKTYRDKKNKNS